MQTTLLRCFDRRGRSDKLVITQQKDAGSKEILLVLLLLLFGLKIRKTPALFTG